MPSWCWVLLIGLGSYGCLVALNVVVCFQTVMTAVDTDAPDEDHPPSRRQQAYLFFLGMQGAIAFWLFRWARRGLRHELLSLTGYLALAALAFPLYELIEHWWDAGAAITATSLWFTFIVSIPIAGLLRPTTLRLG